jgi:hypothetical protein
MAYDACNLRILKNIDSGLLWEYHLLPARVPEVAETSPKSIEQAIAEALGVPGGALLIKALKWAVGLICTTFLVLGGTIYYLHGDISEIKGKLDAIPAATAQKLVEQSKSYFDSGKTAEAAKALVLATMFFNDAKMSKASVNKAFFEDTYVKLNQLKGIPQLSNEWQSARLELASYRSVLQSPPKITKPEKRVNAPVNLDQLKDATYLIMNASGEFIVPSNIERKLSNNMGLKNFVLVGGVDGVRQTLDGISWTNDVFENIQIRYEGGEVLLENVKFVNCTFDIANSANGVQVTDYAMLGKPEKVLIGQEVADDWSEPDLLP